MITKNKSQQQKNLTYTKNRKNRIKNLISLGQIIENTKLDHLEHTTLLGAFTSLSDTIKQNPNIIEIWNKIGHSISTKSNQKKIPIIIKLQENINQNTQNILKELDLKFNHNLNEYFGYTNNINLLHSKLQNIKYRLEIIKALP